MLTVCPDDRMLIILDLLVTVLVFLSTANTSYSAIYFGFDKPSSLTGSRHLDFRGCKCGRRFSPLLYNNSEVMVLQMA